LGNLFQAAAIIADRIDQKLEFEKLTGDMTQRLNIALS
jgi:hypothetical protein